MEKLPYILFSGAPIGPLAERALTLADYPPAAIISDTALSADEQIEVIESHNAAFILVVGYGAIIKQSVLDSVAGQALNIHPSLLPAYRGPAPVVQAILDGVTETGVTLMQIDRLMDHGPILAQSSHPLHGKETPDELYAVLTQRGVELFLESIDPYLKEELEPLPQQHDEATYTHFVEKSDGLLDFSKPAEVLEREVRAYQGWPTSWLLHESKRLIILKAHCSEGLLQFDQVKPEGGKPMSWSAYCAGKRQKPTDLYHHLTKG